MSAALAPVRLALSDTPHETATPTSWIGPLVALGGMACRYQEAGRQLVVAVSVPRRDFAAALIGCGWIIARPAPTLVEPRDAVREIKSGSLVRLVTEREVLVDEFLSYDERDDARIQLRGTQWLLSKVRAVASLSGPGSPIRQRRPDIGSLARWKQLDATWDHRLAAGVVDLAIIGTLKWLREDFDAHVTVSQSILGIADAWLDADAMGCLLLPSTASSATAFTCLYAASRLADELPLPEQLRLAILDGASAVKYVSEIESPLVICVLDRSVGDETAAEILVQLRNSRGEPISLKDSLGWRPPTGVEALAFTVPL